MEKSEIEDQIQTLKKRFLSLGKNFDQEEKEQNLEHLETQSLEPKFWEIPEKAQKISQKLAQIKKSLENWQTLSQNLDYLLELRLESQNFKDFSEVEFCELQNLVSEIETQIVQQENEQYLRDPYDDHDVVLTIHTGNGGQDAEDFSNLLFRMYLRFAEKKNFQTKILENSASEVGLKSATIFVSGPLAYGTLKGEHGIHRLIRLSPFNAKNLRQTSFARVEILPKIEQDETFEIEAKDLRVDVFRSSGAGGQSVNTTDSAVRVTYIPLNIVATCQNERSQQQNKANALSILKSRILKLKLEQNASEMSAIKGSTMENSFGSQIRTYTLHPYKMVKDHRTLCESAHPEKVLDGNLEPFVEAFFRMPKNK